MHLTQHGNGTSEITKCSKFFKAPNLINHVLFYSLHGQHVSDELPVTAASATSMAKWISGEMDAVLSGKSEIQKHSCEVPYWKNGEQCFWHNEEQSKIFPKSLVQVHCHAVKYLAASCLIPRMLPHVLKMSARESHKLFSYTSDVVGSKDTSNGEPTTPNVVSKILPSDHDLIACDMQASMLEQ